jgi:hypothetical protein
VKNEERMGHIFQQIMLDFSLYIFFVSVVKNTFIFKMLFSCTTKMFFVSNSLAKNKPEELGYKIDELFKPYRAIC